MIEQYILSKLTDKGRILFWLIQAILDALLYFGLTRCTSLTFSSLHSSGLTYLIFGIFGIAALAATITLVFFKKKADEGDDIQ